MAGFLDFGTSPGLGYQYDWNSAMNRNLQLFQMQQNATDERNKKIAYYAEQMKGGKVFNPYDTLRLQKFYQGLHQQIADIHMQYGDGLESNLEGMTKLSSVMEQFTNNHILEESKMVQGEYSKLLDAAASGKVPTSVINEQMDKFHKYITQGYESDGSEKSEQNHYNNRIQPFSYKQAYYPDLNAIIDKYKVNLKTIESVHHGDGYYGNVLTLDHDELEKQTQNILTDPDAYDAVHRAFESTGHNFYSDESSYVRESLRNSIQTGEQFRSKDDSWRWAKMNMAKQQSPGISYFQNDIYAPIMKALKTGGKPEINVDGGKGLCLAPSGPDGILPTRSYNGIKTGYFTEVKMQNPDINDKSAYKDVTINGSVKPLSAEKVIFDENSGQFFLKMQVEINDQNTNDSIKGNPSFAKFQDQCEELKKDIPNTFGGSAMNFSLTSTEKPVKKYRTSVLVSIPRGRISEYDKAQSLNQKDKTNNYPISQQVQTDIDNAQSFNSENNKDDNSDVNEYDTAVGND